MRSCFARIRAPFTQQNGRRIVGVICRDWSYLFPVDENLAHDFDDWFEHPENMAFFVQKRYGGVDGPWVSVPSRRPPTKRIARVRRPVLDDEGNTIVKVMEERGWLTPIDNEEDLGAAVGGAAAFESEAEQAAFALSQYGIAESDWRALEPTRLGCRSEFERPVRAILGGKSMVDVLGFEALVDGQWRGDERIFARWLARSRT